MNIIRKVPLLLLATMILGGCSWPGSTKTTKPEVQPIAVSVVEAKHGRITATSPASAQIEPVLSVAIVAKTSGRVMAVHKEMGDKVKEGDLLVQLEDSDASAQLLQARASLAQAGAQQAEAQRQYTRLSELYKAGAVSKQQLEQVETQVSLANANVSAASASVDMAQTNYERTQITAPAAGTLASRTVEPGALVGAGTPLFQLVDLSTVVVKANVAERDINSVKAGASVAVKVPSLERDFTGTVEAVSPAMDRQTRSFPVRVTLPNADGLLKGGMFAQVQFAVREEEGVLVPVSALVEREGNTYVFVISGETVKQQKVTVRVTTNDVSAVDGIPAGSKVVVAGQNRLYDGAPVKAEGSTTP